VGNVHHPRRLRSPVKDVSELKLVDVASPEEGVAPYKLQAAPARKLKNLQGIPIVIVTSEGSFASPGIPAPWRISNKPAARPKKCALPNSASMATAT